MQPRTRDSEAMRAPGSLRTLSRVRTSPLAVAAAIAAVATRVLPLPVGVVRSTLLPSTSSMMASSCASYSSMFFVSVAHSRMHSNIASALSSSSAITARVSDPGLTPASSMASCFSGNSTSAAAPATKRARRETRDVAGACLAARPTRSSRRTPREVPAGTTADREATALILPRVACSLPRRRRELKRRASCLSSRVTADRSRVFIFRGARMLAKNGVDIGEFAARIDEAVWKSDKREKN